jgi:AraC-like DNA-binding protein
MTNSLSFGRPTDGLPPLLVGSDSAIEGNGFEALFDALSVACPNLKGVAPTASPQSLRFRLSVFHLGSMALASKASESYAAQSDPFGAKTILIPTAGRYQISAGGKAHVAAPGTSGLLLSGNHALSGIGFDYAGVAFNIDPARLDRVVSAMRGGSPSSLSLDTERELPLGVLDRLGLGANLQGLLTQIDAASKVPGLAEMLGLEDLLYRHVALLLAPDLFMEEAPSRAVSGVPRAMVMELCDRIDAALPATLRLSDLEAMSGFSTRALQYAFKRFLGCSPAEWIRDRRLARVHTRLLTPHPEDTVTSIALTEGFFHLGDFSRRFNQRYGLLPSVMLARTRRSS